MEESVKSGEKVAVWKRLKKPETRSETLKVRLTQAELSSVEEAATKNLNRPGFIGVRFVQKLRCKCRDIVLSFHSSSPLLLLG